MDLEWWRTATIGGAAVGQTLFVLFYATLPWWRSFLGRALFFKAVTFALLIDVAVVGRVWDWYGEEACIVGLYGFVALGIWAQLAAFVRQRVKEEPMQQPSNLEHGLPGDAEPMPADDAEQDEPTLVNEEDD